LEPKFDARLFQATEPGAEEHGRLLTARKDPPAGANVGFDFQRLCPPAKRIRTKFSQQFAPAIRFRPIPRGKISHRLAMSKIQSAATGDEKLSPG
jgi:hypothetical protein